MTKCSNCPLGRLIDVPEKDHGPSSMTSEFVNGTFTDKFGYTCLFDKNTYKGNQDCVHSLNEFVSLHEKLGKRIHSDIRKLLYDQTGTNVYFEFPVKTK